MCTCLSNSNECSRGATELKFAHYLKESSLSYLLGTPAMTTLLSTSLILLRSICVASSLGFLVPVLGVSAVLIGLELGSYLPGVAWVSQACFQGVVDVLATFGAGRPLEGLMVIGGAFALVSALFDGYVIYRQRLL